MSIRNNWRTPPDIFKEILKLYPDIEYDGSCTKEDCLIAKPLWKDFLYTPGKVQILHKRKNPTIFINPPYGKGILSKFIQQAWNLSLYSKFILLVPDNILSTKYCDILDNCEGKNILRSWKFPYISIRHFNKRIKFLPPLNSDVKVSSPTFGCMLLIFDRRTQKN